MELKDLIVSLSSIMTISGFESRSAGQVEALVGEFFDECKRDNVGNVCFIKKSTRQLPEGEKRAKILIDAHFDEVGMIVTDIKDGGFLTVTNIGGIDSSLLQASDVVIYGKEKLFGVVASTPPHLSTPDDRNKLKRVDELLIDTGYSKETLEKLVRVGTPVGYSTVYSELKNGKICGKALDDKACAACAIYALANIPSDELYGDVYMLLSIFEETGGGGVVPAAFGIEPDYAMVIDVDLAAVPDAKKPTSIEMGKGPSITYTTATDIALTKMLHSAAKDAEIPTQKFVSAASTGTNSVRLHLAGNGVPVVDVGLPLAFMHSATEIVDIVDCESLANLVKVFVKDEKIGKEYTTNE
jgi:endoglucanase